MKNKKFELKYLTIIAFTVLLWCNSLFSQIQTIRTFDTGAEVFLGSANMDNDPQQELVYTGRSGTSTSLYIIDGNSGQIEWTGTNFYEIYIAGYNVSDRDKAGANYGVSPFCDINRDGLYELTFYGRLSSNAPGKIYVVGLQGTSTGVSADNFTNIPDEASLYQNYPNPFNPNTKIEYEIPNSGITSIKIYNTLGQLVKTLINEPKQAGSHSAIWDGKNEKGQTVSSGTYFYQLQVGDFVSNKRMLLLK